MVYMARCWRKIYVRFGPGSEVHSLPGMSVVPVQCGSSAHVWDGPLRDIRVFAIATTQEPVQTVTWVPTSTTRPVGICKKSVALLADLAKVINGLPLMLKRPDGM